MLLTDRFASRLAQQGLPPLQRQVITTVQVNLGRLCNQTCHHCHVDAGPDRTEAMDEAGVQRLLTVLDKSQHVSSVDLTGGAPELNPHFRPLVDELAARGLTITVRCNLTVTTVPSQRDLPQFYAERGVHVVASLPCYTSDNVDKQRGDGAFASSIAALKALNAQGYGAVEGAVDDDALRLDLVFNPGGPTLPPPQAALEADYRERLRDDFGVRFDRLLTLANMPIHRFAADLQARGRLHEYQELLSRSFNPLALPGLMCRNQLSVKWDGRLHDCDFHLVLDLPVAHRSGPTSLWDIESFDELDHSAVTTADHCLGCTAGQGSSCGGALTGAPDP